MSSPIVPIITLAEALQNVTEALEKLGSKLEPSDRKIFDATVKRIRQERVSLLAWISENS